MMIFLLTLTFQNYINCYQILIYILFTQVFFLLIYYSPYNFKNKMEVRWKLVVIFS